jgi:transposase-like protein
MKAWSSDTPEAKTRCPDCKSDQVKKTGSSGDNDMYITVFYRCKSCGHTFSDLVNNSADGSGA